MKSEGRPEKCLRKYTHIHALAKPHFPQQQIVKASPLYQTRKHVEQGR